MDVALAADLPPRNDPRRQDPVGLRILPKRPLWQTFKYDWLGNTTATDDDQHAMYDRSFGSMTSYATADPNTSKPYQFKEATQPGQISKALSYDATGNLTWMTTGRGTAPCTRQADCGNLQFFYTWDEVGRLVFANRVSSTGPFQRYLYDYNDERVVKEYTELLVPNQPASGVGPKITTLYVFDTLEIRRSPFNPVTKQYPVDSTNEVVYLNANGMRLARLHYEPPSKGEPQLVTPDAKHASNLHILLNLPDHLGSSGLIIDHATSELVEARTYQPYGATESDYRPERWKGFREDYGFTGKEEDLEAGLIYFGKRYLNPYLGRWISADPLAVHVPGSADLNLYAYVRGNVLKNTDPLGLRDVPKEYQQFRGQLANSADTADRNASAAQDAAINETDEDKSWEYQRQADQWRGTASDIRARIGELDEKYQTYNGVTQVDFATQGPSCGVCRQAAMVRTLQDYDETVDAIKGSGVMVIPLVVYALYRDGSGQKMSLTDMKDAAKLAAAANLVVETGFAAKNYQRGKGQLANMPAVEPGVAEDQAARSIAASKGRAHAAYIGGRTPDGRVVSGCSSNPTGCAERDAQRQGATTFSRAYGFRFEPTLNRLVLKTIPVCTRCQQDLNRAQFPADVTWDPGGRWDHEGQ